MRNFVEVFRQIGVNHVGVAPANQPVHFLDRIGPTTTGPLAQVRSNQESTDRQYNLLNKARSLGWNPEQIRILDRDLGQSGAAATKRADFKTLVSDVAMGQIGAIFALEASRLARSNQDWHRLLELCAITGTLVIDEDGCYDPAEFNDSLVLGMKGTFAQAE